MVGDDGTDTILQPILDGFNLADTGIAGDEQVNALFNKIRNARMADPVRFVFSYREAINDVIGESFDAFK